MKPSKSELYRFYVNFQHKQKMSTTKNFGAKITKKNCDETLSFGSGFIIEILEIRAKKHIKFSQFENVRDVIICSHL